MWRPGKPAPPTTPHTDALGKSVPDDLRSLLTPKKTDLRSTIKNRTPAAPRKLVKMVLLTPPDPNYTGPGARAGTDQMDV